MTQGIAKFLASIRRKLFAARVDREIFFKIFPHLNQKADHGYSFKSNDEMVRAHVRGHLQTSLDLDLIERVAARMPKAYGDAFRYIVYRDLNKRMEEYMELAERRIQPETCDPRWIATHA
jgi:hypothetical protein